jgi:hypothetical protein
MGPPSTPSMDWEISTSIPAIERWSLKSRKVASLQRDSPYCMLRDSQRICHVVLALYSTLTGSLFAYLEPSRTRYRRLKSMSLRNGMLHPSPFDSPMHIS